MSHRPASGGPDNIDSKHFVAIDRQPSREWTEDGESLKPIAVTSNIREGCGTRTDSASIPDNHSGDDSNPHKPGFGFAVVFNAELCVGVVSVFIAARRRLVLGQFWRRQGVLSLNGR